MSVTRPVAVITILAVIAMPVLFDITVDPVFRLPRDVQQPDPGQEARFESCMQARDREIHHRAFDTIDNPDVQKEYISSRRERAAEDCRAEFPRQMITVHEPLQFNLVDVEPRFGKKLSYQ